LLDSLQRFAFVEFTPDDNTLPIVQDIVVIGERQVSYADLRGFIQDQGIFTNQILDALEPKECIEVLETFGFPSLLCRLTILSDYTFLVWKTCFRLEIAYLGWNIMD